MKKLVFIILAVFASLTIKAQQIAVKSDVVWDALTVPNIGVDVVVGNRTTLGVDVFACKNIWAKDIQAYGIQPEYRYYFSGRAMHQHYIGLGGIALAYKQEFNEKRHVEGYAAGPGLLFGYVMHLGKRWNIDFHAGCGVIVYHEKKMEYSDKSKKWVSCTDKGLFPAPTSLGISINYVLK